MATKRSPKGKPPAPALDQFSRLQAAADLFNRELFNGELPPVFLSMVNKPGCYGTFRPRRYRGRNGEELDLIALDATTAIVRPLIEVMSSLVAQQCKQLIYLASGCKATSGTGPAWRELMTTIGLPPVQVGPSWNNATHRIDPDGLFAQVFEEHRQELQELPWEEASGAAAQGTGTRKDRVRFQCPRCEQNAWARPAGELLCGTCSTTAELVWMIPEVSGRTTGDTAAAGPQGADTADTPEPTRMPGLPVFTDELARELRLHTGLDHPPTTKPEALMVLTFGLKQRGHGDAVTELMDSADDSDRLQAALKAVYRIRCRQLHPDVGGSEVAFKALQAAYVMLKAKGRR